MGCGTRAPLPDRDDRALHGARPTRAQLDLLVCRSSRREDDLEHFDFTLPGEVTDYVVTVHFNAEGNIDDIAMER